MKSIDAKKIASNLWSFYQQNVGVLLPLIGINALAIVIDRVPYLNLIALPIATAILVLSVGILLILIGWKAFHTILVGLAVIFAGTAFLGFNFYQEVLGATIYLLLVLKACALLVSVRTDHLDETSHVESQRALFNAEFATISTGKLARWQESYVERMKKYLLLQATKKSRVVELGCGDGKLSVALATLGHTVTACDISDVSIKLVNRFAKEAGVKVETVQCDVTKLPFKDATFDYAVAGAILEHLEDEQQALLEWARVLKPGGRIMIVTPLRQRHVLPVWWVLNWFHDRRLGHVRRYDRARYEGLSKYGFMLQQVLFTGHTPKVIFTILFALSKIPLLERLAESVDRRLESIEYDGNNIIGFFVKAT